VDPLIGEAPADEALDPNITVPPPSGAGTNVEFAPVPILWSNVREAEEKWANAVADRVSAISEVRSLRLRSKELTREREALEEATQQTIVDLVAATERLQHRAVRGFVQTSSGNPSSALLSDGSAPAGELSTEMFRSRELLVHQRKTKLVQAVVDVDQAGLGQLAALRESLGAGAIELVQRWSIVESSLRRAETAARELSVDIDQAKIELEAFKAGSDIYVDGVVFPIAGDYSVPLINSFGFPRMPGTPDAHSHQGIDIFAPRGTPLVAAERGVIGRIGNGRLGGLKFWLRGESGADWYYAHLDGFAPGLHNGQVVEAGELLGYVGNTGNAIGTPPHLHLEIHPNGGGAVNPYPLLKVVSDLDRKAFVEGTHPGFRYQPVVQGRPDDENPVAAATTVTTAGEQTTTTAGPEPSPSSRGTITESTAAESTTASTAPATSASIAPSITTPSSVASSTAAAAASESTATTAATSTKSGSGGGTGGETGS
jgi:murein DD-endopeptidase MepM/ murein hydrolase activator NlpD